VNAAPKWLLRPLPGSRCASRRSRLRFLVCLLHGATKETVRLATAVLDVALSQAFRRMRQGGRVDIKKVLDDAQRHAELIVGMVKLRDRMSLLSSKTPWMTKGCRCLPLSPRAGY
jgi:hypothetical protein